jgi:hypothetical protein
MCKRTRSDFVGRSNASNGFKQTMSATALLCDQLDGPSCDARQFICGWVQQLFALPPADTENTQELFNKDQPLNVLQRMR